MQAAARLHAAHKVADREHESEIAVACSILRHLFVEEGTQGQQDKIQSDDFADNDEKAEDIGLLVGDHRLCGAKVAKIHLCRVR